MGLCVYAYINKLRDENYQYFFLSLFFFGGVSYLWYDKISAEGDVPGRYLEEKTRVAAGFVRTYHRASGSSCQI